MTNGNAVIVFSIAPTAKKSFPMGKFYVSGKGRLPSDNEEHDYYLHRDGSWHRMATTSADKFAGYFDSLVDAETALTKALLTLCVSGDDPEIQAREDALLAEVVKARDAKLFPGSRAYRHRDFFRRVLLGD